MEDLPLIICTTKCSLHRLLKNARELLRYVLTVFLHFMTPKADVEGFILNFLFFGDKCAPRPNGYQCVMLVSLIKKPVARK